jgi:L-Lysine epsilon oxidase N-terminal
MQANGRLLFIGGDGSAGSPTNQPVGKNGNFADNDGWFDTISDGVVRAKVTPNGGQESEALAAWVIVAPPDYAPALSNVVTMYDVLLDKATERGVLPAMQTVVFTRHVRPILERAMGYQWVNRAARIGFDGTSGGHSTGGIGDFALQMDQLGDPTAANGTRVRIFGFLRDPEGAPPHK